MNAATWLFDLGNTRLKFAPMQADGRIGPVQAIAHDHADDWQAPLQQLPRGALALLASVGPARAHAQLMSALAGRFGRIERATTQRAIGGLKIAYAQPQRLGVDRWLALLALHGAGRAPVLLVGIGTALTIDLLAAGGAHVGGLIAPSPALMRQSLHQRVQPLPATGGQRRDFADDTADALASGCEGAALALIQRSLEQARARIGGDVALVLHGGGAAALQADLPQAVVHEHLVLEGLAQWAQASA